MRNLRTYIMSAICIVLSFTSNGQNLYDINNITTIDVTFQESNWDQLLDNLVSEGLENRLIGSVTINGVFFDSVGVRYKGNSSYNTSQIKNPLNIKLDHIINNQDYDGFGTLKLANVFKDPSFVREVLSYEIIGNYMPSPMANFAKVSVNGYYIGLYTSVQSVDKFFIGNNFYGNDNPFFKGELQVGQNGTVWSYFGQDSSNYSNFYEIESDYGWSELIEFLNVLNNTPESINNYLNVDRHLWMLAFDILCVNLDAPVNFAHNYYLYMDNSNRFNPIVWDLNENFGIFSHLLNQPPGPLDMVELDPFLNINDTDYPIIHKILNTEEYKLKYLAHFRTIMKEIFESDYYYTRAVELQNFISDEVQNDPNKLYSFSEFEDNLTTSIGFGPQAMVGITELMDNRITWLNLQQDFQYILPEVISNDIYPTQPVINSTISFTASTNNTNDLWIYFRYSNDEIFNSLQMYDDGQHNDNQAGDGIYGLDIEITSTQLQYYFYAINNDASSFLPERAEYEFFSLTTSGDIVINEFMASNNSYVSDQDNEYDDWIELYNNSNLGINLNGYFLTDNPQEPEKWIFPDTILQSGEWIIIWADKDTLQSGLHTNFKLSSSGETIVLSSPTGELVDEISYSVQTTDISTGRYPNGTGNFVAMDPSFEQENTESLDIIEITEPEKNSSSLICFPNPCNNTTSIRFNINEDTNVDLSIFDISGKQLMNIETNFLLKGDHTYKINTSLLANGISICVLKTQNNIQSIKIITLD